MLIVWGSTAQNKSINTIENVYLHTDRSTYFLGEDLWYKAYNVNAFTGLLTDLSNVLYVELISSDSKIISRQKIKLEMGLGHGDLKLTDSVGVKSGHYQLRAYTNWNRNFGDDFIFTKNIEIIDVFKSHFGSETEENSNTEVPKASEQINNTFKIEFFPEGGSLLKNVASVVGFKAVDLIGNPIEVSGDIFDANNLKIASFSSEHDGMGKFQILPLQNQPYYAIARINTGDELLQELPEVLTEGYKISYKNFKGRNIIAVSTNQETLGKNPNKNVKVVCKLKGVSYLEIAKKVNTTTALIELPEDKLKAGINQITLYDSDSKPQSERLVYFEKANDLNVTLETNKQSYEPNENVIINVSSKQKTGKPQSASFSLSVTDMNGEDAEQNYSSNICSYYLMESDVRGEIHQPNYYFNPKNPKRLTHLDNLLLTQGWRDFLWKSQPKINDTLGYKVEKGITISGRVEQLFSKNPMVNNNVTLGLINKNGFNAFNTTTDSLGEFKFEKLIFSSKTDVFLSTNNQKGKQKGFLYLNKEEKPLQVTFKLPELNPLESTTVINYMYGKYMALGVPPENILDEVEITASKRDDLDFFYGAADYKYVPDVADKNLYSISDILDNVPGVSNGKITGENKPPMFLIDTYEGDAAFVLPSEVERIEVIRPSEMLIAIYGEEASHGIISIITNGKSRSNQPKKDSVHSLKRQIEGFYEARKFYESTNKNSSEEDNKLFEARNTIYWNPYVHPDKLGKASVNYHNTNTKTKVKVQLEGITSSGIPVVKKVYYNIVED
ncbi:hypothetical protein PK35_14895 [Tamlana nanhaiensis]|uniref:TonB-dependent receptor plug domain-containing protein n=1 Tax=Neotamlana nanhaiensis TaxID=1382798 RepID=A0A0D7VWZ1_9FLAO|nr:hypothetical protein PK35_14895 [Tamlana nanhaiensis]